MRSWIFRKKKKKERNKNRVRGSVIKAKGAWVQAYSLTIFFY